jgi:hypothetical protein
MPDTDPRRRLFVAVAVFGVVVVALFAHSVAITDPAEQQASARTPSDVKLVTVDPESDASLWPYTSRRHRFETLTLPINVVVDGDAARVRSLLVSREIGAPGTIPGGDADAGTSPAWRPAQGATRYSYVHTASPETGGWTDETFQLQHGDYFGTRYHIRAYEGGTGDDRWTALQAHHEHWDWFRLRHTVGSTARGQRYVEQQFYGRSSVSSVDRHRFANGGPSDADGWATTVSLAGFFAVERSGVLAAFSLALLVGLGMHREGLLDALRRHADETRPSRARLLLVASLLALPTGVRAASLAAHRLVPALSPKPIAAVGYLVLALGLPACAALASRDLPPETSAPLAGASLVLGFLLDYVFLDVTVVPVSVVTNRFALAVVVAVVAAGGSRWGTDATSRNPLLVAGVGLWILTLLWPVSDRLLALASLG